MEYREKELIAELFTIRDKSPSISIPEEALKHFVEYKNRTTEYFSGLLLDNGNYIIKKCLFFKGTVDQTAIYPREMVKKILRYDASGIILCHNHPGRNCEPSKQDIEMTLRLQKVFEPLSIRLLDHLIISKHGYYSMNEQGDL